MKTVIKINIDSRTKKNARKTAEMLGLSLHDVVNAYLKQFIQKKEVMKPELESLIEEIEQDIKKKKNVSKPITTQREVIKRLSSL